MEQDFFKKLPSDIFIYILSGLPFRTIMNCKCVSKSWLNLVRSPEFAKSHFSKSVPGLAVSQRKTSSIPDKFFEFVDEAASVTANHFNVVFNFSFPHDELMHSSANGLVFLFSHKNSPCNLFVCNPVTHEYIKIPAPREPSSPVSPPSRNSFGFGVTKVTGQYKLVRIFHEYIPGGRLSSSRAYDQSMCQVYTLGTGTWRSIVPSGLVMYEPNTVGAFLNGNFHWLIYDMDRSPLVFCFDLETELFSTFSTPDIRDYLNTLCVLEECLALCDNSANFEIVIWLMSEYGDDKSWTKKFIIRRTSPYDFCGILYPIKAFKDGDILIAREGYSVLLCYSNKTRTIEVIGMFELHGYDNISAVCYTPSFLPLNTFTMESFDSYTPSQSDESDLQSFESAICNQVFLV